MTLIMLALTPLLLPGPGPSVSRRVLVVCQGATQGSMRLVSYDALRGVARILWQAQLTGVQSIVDVKDDNRQGRLFLLCRRAASSIVSTLDAGTGRVIGSPLTVPRSTFGLANLGGHAVCVLPGRVLGLPTSYDGRKDNQAVVAFPPAFALDSQGNRLYLPDSESSAGSAFGTLSVYEAHRGGVRLRGWKDYSYNGPYGAAATATHLLVLRNGALLDLYRLGESMVLERTIRDSSNWDRAWPDSTGERFYRLGRGELQVFELSRREGLKAQSGAVPCTASPDAEIWQDARSLVLFDRDGWVYGFWKQGKGKIRFFGRHRLGAGPNWPIGPALAR